jgi:hypothetical protein
MIGVIHGRCTSVSDLIALATEAKLGSQVHGQATNL